MRHGLLRGSCIPPLPQRDLRDLTRQRTNLVHDRARVVNQLQNVLEWANLKLASVVSDIMGVSACMMLAQIIGGQADQTVLAELAQGKLRAKHAELERALEGHVRPHHRFMLAQHLMHIDVLEEQIATFDAPDRGIYSGTDAATSAPKHRSDPVDRTPPVASSERVDAVPWDEAVALVDTVPGVGQTLAESVIAEVGTDMRRFPSAAHLASWAKVSPGNHESAGKRSQQ